MKTLTNFITGILLSNGYPERSIDFERLEERNLRKFGFVLRLDPDYIDVLTVNALVRQIELRLQSISSDIVDSFSVTLPSSTRYKIEVQYKLTPEAMQALFIPAHIDQTALSFANLCIETNALLIEYYYAVDKNDVDDLPGHETFTIFGFANPLLKLDANRYNVSVSHCKIVTNEYWPDINAGEPLNHFIMVHIISK